MLNRERFQNCQNSNFCIFPWLSSKKHNSLKELGWNHFIMKWKQLFTESLEHETLFNMIVCGSNWTHKTMHNLKT